MLYATMVIGDHHFLGVVPSQKGSYELSPEEKNRVEEALPLTGEWMGGVWSFNHPEMDQFLDNMEDMERSEKATQFLIDCRDILEDE